MRTRQVEKKVGGLPAGKKVSFTFKRDGRVSDMWYLFRAIVAGYFTADEQLQTYLKRHWRKYPNHSTWPVQFSAPEKRSFVVTSTGQAFDVTTFPPYLAKALESLKVIG